MKLGRAVLVALFLGRAALSQAAVRQEDIDRAVDRGRAFLEHTCEEALKRGNLEATERVGQSALSLYTLIQCGSKPDGDVVRELLLHVSTTRIHQTYDASCTLLALAAHDPMAHRPWVDELAQQIEQWQSESGDWSYPAGHADLSNTQYAALGLWAASRCGYEADPRVWQRLASATLEYAEDEGGFAYVSGNARRGGATGSMTAAGVGTLAICEGRLRRAGALTAELGRDLGLARERGLGWLAKHFDVATNPRAGGWHYYYLYGLERLGALAGAPRIGEHDWYDEGARLLLKLQDEKGSWNGGTDLSETCFALLFLRRATAFEPRTPRTGEDAARDDGAIRLDCDGAGPVSFAIGGWSPKVLGEIEWPGERGRGPHVVSVEYVIDGQAAAAVVGSPARPAGATRFRATQVFDREGAHSAVARATVLLSGGDTRTLESAPREFKVVNALPAWLRDRRPLAKDNQLPRFKPKAKASSTAKPAKAPFGIDPDADLAIDGNPRTAWLAAESDDRRELTITLQRSEPCRVLQVRAAVLEPLGPLGLSRPLVIEVSVNGKSRGELAMSPDPRQPMRVVFDEPLVVKRIDLAITQVAASDSCPLVGIGEVELFERAP
jgi:hypothetical protein